VHLANLKLLQAFELVLYTKTGMGGQQANTGCKSFLIPSQDIWDNYVTVSNADLLLSTMLQ
jgi:hypothetical protein